MSIKKSLEDYRPGAVGSLVDEYERAALELKSVLQAVGEADYARIADAETENEDCRSIRTIMSHVVRAGYGYANYIRAALSMNAAPVAHRQIERGEILGAIDEMLAYTVEIFDGRWQALDEEMISVPINTRWGVIYNIDQLLEHAIVHVLRHRRQIEKFLLKFKNP